MADEGVENSAASLPAGGGSNKLVTVLTIVNLLAVLGMGAVLFLSFQKQKEMSVADISLHDPAGAHAEAEGKASAGHGEGTGAADGKSKETEATTKFGRMVALEQFTVNLNTPGTTSPKFVRVNISIEVPTADTETEVTQKMPQVRNAIIDLFNSKRPSDLASVEGRDYIKEEIRNALNGFVTTGKVKGVFFTNFAVGS